MNQFEIQFESNFIKECEKQYISAYHIPSDGGTHDLHLFRFDRGMTIEAKAIHKKDLTRSIKTKFRPDQRGYYESQIKTSVTPTTIIVCLYPKLRITKQGLLYSTIYINSLHEIDIMFSSKWEELFFKDINTWSRLDDFVDHFVRRLDV